MNDQNQWLLLLEPGLQVWARFSRTYYIRIKYIYKPDLNALDDK